MNIRILDSWLREYLKTSASPQKIAECMSLASVSIEKLESSGGDWIYDIEVTTNRPDLMSVVGLAREGAAVLPQFGIEAKFNAPKFEKPNVDKKLVPTNSIPARSRTETTVGKIEITNDSKLVNRICAVALEINLGKSPQKVSRRIESSDIRSLNNAVDVTNYVMREIGHPVHVFDYDKLAKTGKLIIRESKKGEKIQTLDEKEYVLAGGDIVADDGTGRIIDLLGVMGTLNSAVDDNTKRVLLFVDNNNPVRIRKTSMSLAIRSEAATLNEKGADPEIAYGAVLRGVELLEEIADGKMISEVLDIYPNKPKSISVTISEQKINAIVGTDIPLKTSKKILEDLGFQTNIIDSNIKAKVPSWRLNDVQIEEDLIEEIVRIYGYQKLPSRIPAFETGEPFSLATNQFYWERTVKDALKFFGFTEVYTYSMFSEDLLEVSTDDAVTIRNPLDSDHVYMRTSLVPSLLEAVRENKGRIELKLFEMANVYIKKQKNLPDEKLKLAGIYKSSTSLVLDKNPKASFLDVKGIIEALLEDLGISAFEFKPTESGAFGAAIYIGKDSLGEIEQLEEDLIDFEFDFETILKYATLKKVYKPISKFPESIEDLRFEIDETIPYEKIVRNIREQSNLIKDVSLLDIFQNKKTFRIIYQSYEKNLTNEDLTNLREKITSVLKSKFKAEPA